MTYDALLASPPIQWTIVILLKVELFRKFLTVDDDNSLGNHWVVTILWQNAITMRNIYIIRIYVCIIVYVYTYVYDKHMINLVSLDYYFHCSH